MVGLIPVVCLVTLAAAYFGLPALPFFLGGTLVTCVAVYWSTRSPVPLKLGFGCLVVTVSTFMFVSMFSHDPIMDTTLFHILASAWIPYVFCGTTLVAVGVLGTFGDGARRHTKATTGASPRS